MRRCGVPMFPHFRFICGGLAGFASAVGHWSEPLERGMRGDIKRASSPRGGVIDTGVSAAERERAFRRARRHSLLVRSLKVLLPVAAVGCLGIYGGALIFSSGLKIGDIAASKVTIDPTNLTMTDPRYNGFGKDGSEYKVHARTAVTDIRMAAPIRLDLIDGELIHPNGVVTYLNAKWGTYDQKKDLLELYESIDVDATNGMTARLTRATVLAKESRIISNEPVQAQTDTGKIRADTMTLDTKARKAKFKTAVHVTLKPSKPTTASRGAETAPKRETANAFGIDANSSEPVVVTSEQLDVDDNAKTALFRTNVVARQGEATLEAPELDVTYTGRANFGDTGASTSKPEGVREATSLKSIKARGGVRMASKADRAESQSLDYDAATERVLLVGDVTMTQQPDRTVKAETALLDQKADTALLTGDVEVTQGRNVLKSGRLAIDRKSGTAKLTTPASSGKAAGRISTLIYQNQTSKPGAPSKASATEDEPGLGPLGASFRSDPNAPIDVEAQVLDVNDRKHTAVYTGSVVAKQGTFIVRTEEMTAHYSGETGLVAASQPVAKDKAKAGGASGSELRRVEARRGVVVTGSDSQQATGEWATFDAKANTIVMGGNVTVTQGKRWSARLRECACTSTSGPG
jgi:lipopolysaccharide transport protein LptA